MHEIRLNTFNRTNCWNYYTWVSIEMVYELQSFSISGRCYNKLCYRLLSDCRPRRVGAILLPIWRLKTLLRFVCQRDTEANTSCSYLFSCTFKKPVRCDSTVEKPSDSFKAMKLNVISVKGRTLLSDKVGKYISQFFLQCIFIFITQVRNECRVHKMTGRCPKKYLCKGELIP